MRDRSQETLLGPICLTGLGPWPYIRAHITKARRPENWVFSAAAVSHPDPREGAMQMDGGGAAGAEKYEQELQDTLADLKEHDDV